MVKDGKVLKDGEKELQDAWSCRCGCGNICACQKENLRMEGGLAGIHLDADKSK